MYHMRSLLKHNLAEYGNFTYQINTCTCIKQLFKSHGKTTRQFIGRNKEWCEFTMLFMTCP